MRGKSGGVRKSTPPYLLRFIIGVTPEWIGWANERVMGYTHPCLLSSILYSLRKVAEIPCCLCRRHRPLFE